MMFDNLILNTDTYKASHFTFEEVGTTGNYAYIEARKGGDFNEVMFFGLQYYLSQYLMRPIEAWMIDEAEEQLMAHCGVFNREGWEYILNQHGGYIPVRVKALPEGIIVPHGTVQVTIEATDPKCSWVASYIETAILRSVWYGSTIASRSHRWSQSLKPLLATSGTVETLPFKIVDFGARGVECAEAAAIGGAAHLISQQLTDNQLGIRLARGYYSTYDGAMFMPGYSIPATEHSVTTAWGATREGDFFRNILAVHGSRPRIDGKRNLVSVVIDSYDQDAALNYWGTELKDALIQSNMGLVARPDSGDPVTNVVHVLDRLASLFGFAVNDRGYRVLPDYVRVIQGDGIDEASLTRIAKYVNANKWSLDNLNFGSGGGLLQKDVTRDTHRYAMKSSEVVVNGETRAVRKTVKTDPSKESKAGRFSVYQMPGYGAIVTAREGQHEGALNDLLQPVYENGRLLREMSFQEVRDNVARYSTQQ